MQVITNPHVVIFPTHTVWRMGKVERDATHTDAFKRVVEVSQLATNTLIDPLNGNNAYVVPTPL